MIKTRLIQLLSDSARYIAFQVLWMWLSLAGQITLIWSFTGLLRSALDGSMGSPQILRAACAGAVPLQEPLLTGRTSDSQKGLFLCDEVSPNRK